MVRSGEWSAADLAEQHLAAIAAGEESVHAFTLVTEDLARAQAAAVDARVAAGRTPAPWPACPWP